MRYTFILLAFISFYSYGQTYSLPVHIFDTMIFEIQRGRECHQLQLVQAEELEKQGAELLQTSKALNLSLSYSQIKDKENESFRLALSSSEAKNELVKKESHRKGFRKGIFIGGVLVIIALLL